MESIQAQDSNHDSNSNSNSFPNPVQVLLGNQPLDSQPQPRTISIPDASVNLRQNESSLPHIKLHIPSRAVPSELHQGLKEIANNSFRSEINFCTKESHGCMEAGGQISDKGKGQKGQWWWNLEFLHDPNLPKGSLEITPSSSDFTSSTPESPSSTAFVSTPFIVTVRYSTKTSAFRSLGHILSVSNSPCISVSSLKDQDTTPSHPNLIDSTGTFALDSRRASLLLDRREQVEFETVGTMIDCSRNGVLKKESVFFLCRMLALMGYNMIQLYTEDTYEIPNEPFFGYLRGPYSFEELSSIDQYAFDLGIEAVPCIQTLGHLGQVLQWPRFLVLRDTTEVLLAELAETYQLLEKMIDAATRPFRSKKIHLGMDETHGLGHGRYHQIFGQHHYKDPTRIFVEHLQRVNQICQARNLKPMIWSDMLFCLSAQNNSLLGYYDSKTKPSGLTAEGIPENIDLVYWDYYHTSIESYISRIDHHIELGRKSPWMAQGSWTWSRFWTALPFTFATCRASLNASKRKESGVRNVFLTIWGDEGNEVDLYSSLPAWNYYAEHCYTQDQEVDVTLLRSKFSGIVNADFDDFVIASRLDDTSPELQSIDDKIHFAPNTSKWLLWEEPVLGFVSPSTTLSGIDLSRHYASLASHLRSKLSFKPTPPSGGPVDCQVPFQSLADLPFNSRLRFPLLLAEVLELKAGLRRELHLAYRRRDWPELDRLAGNGRDSRLGVLRERVKKLSDYHREMWMSMYKPFGFETIDLRYGGLQSRLLTLHLRVMKFLEHVNSGGQVGIPSTPASESLSNLSNLSIQDSNSNSNSNPNPNLEAEHRLTKAREIARKSGVMIEPGPIQDEDQVEKVEKKARDKVEEEDVKRIQVYELPELDVELQLVYASSEQLLDHHRVSRPTYV